MWSKIVPEPSWHTAYNPDALLGIVFPKSDLYSTYGWLARNGRLPPSACRRLQLFGCACARMVWELLPVDARNAVLIRERFADGYAAETDLRASALRLAGAETTAQQHALASAARAGGYHVGATPSATPDWEPTDAARSAAKALATRAAGPAPSGGNPVAKEWQVAWNRTFAAAREHQAEFVRDIFPPPGHAPAVRPDWRTSTVVILARQMDDTGEFSAVPILADALQDAGCDDDLVLDRCRAPSGVHCRGNWVVDLVLGRE